MSKTFSTILRLVKEGTINNNTGFTPKEVIENSTLNIGTVYTFLPKHCVQERKYFERLGVGRYQIKEEFIR